MSLFQNTLFQQLQSTDHEVFHAINAEFDRQQNQIELIASENIASPAVIAAQGSVLTNKYAEGYPGKRYYGGCDHVDIVENLAIYRLKKLFDCHYANVQPNSGSQANQAVLLALLQPGAKILGMSLDAGGHLTHGSRVNLSGKWFEAISYGVDSKTHLLNYDDIEEIAVREKPQLIIAGGSAYTRIINFKRFREIADKVGAYLHVDMAHFAGLVAGGIYPSPLPYADVVTSTTHKTLRGPRGGIILANNEELGKKLNSAVFPGLQGGPLMHVIAGKAVAFGEALTNSFKEYCRAVVKNATVLGETLTENGFNLISNGTDSHVLLVDLTPFGKTGHDVCIALESANITCNKNGIPNDPLPPRITSGIRLGSPACTTRGFGVEEFKQIGMLITQVVRGLGKENQESEIQSAKDCVKKMCDAFPIYAENMKLAS